MAKKNFQTNTGSKSNNFVTDTRTEDLVLAESTFLVPKEQNNSILCSYILFDFF